MLLVLLHQMCKKCQKRIKLLREVSISRPPALVHCKLVARHRERQTTLQIFRDVELMPAKTLTRTARTNRHSPMEHPRFQYPQETEALQEIARSCGLTEEIKWGKPCYMFEGRNIVLIQRFKQYIALMFFKGALLNDPDQLLHRVGEHMQAPRQLRFRSIAEVTNLKATTAAYIKEAIELEKSGAKVPLKKATDLKIPDELQTKFHSDPALKKAFAALTPGRQKGYIFQISAAKQSATRASRVEKYTPKILAGKGLND